MKKAVLKIITAFAVFVILGILQKVLFIVRYHSLMNAAGFSDYMDIIIHGLPMDCTVAGYLTVIPALLTLAQLWTISKVPATAGRIYFAVIAAVLSAITCLDLELYQYWGFRLDMTPIFYFTSSPSSALASVSTHQIFTGILGIAVIAWLIYKIFSLTTLSIRVVPPRRRPVAASVVTLLLTAALIIPIRGGLTVSTMNLSRSYFSHNQRLNHAAVNPAFSLLYSATHQHKFETQYRLMSDDDAASLMAALAAGTISDNSYCSPDSAHNNDTVMPLLNCKQPDIYLIILESFSAHLMPSLGGESIAVNLDSLAREGMSFTNFYANSFRTDRALPSILSGFPAQPSTSLLKYTDKIERLPSIAASLKEAGYNTAYYYGGDINFANINAYLVSSKFDRIIRDKDFPIADRTSKWGAHDHLVFNRAIADAEAESHSEAPLLKVIQTSSSHEPFEVPYSNPLFAGEPKKNAFAYTDSCLMDFVERLRQSPRWDCTLIVMVPDHLGAWPLDLADAPRRHHVPLVMAGGALTRRHERYDMPGSQIDIAATLLGMLDLDSSEFMFSKNLLDPNSPHFAVFTEPSIIGIVTRNDTVVYNCDAEKFEKPADASAFPLGQQTKAYLQTIYTRIAEL